MIDWVTIDTPITMDIFIDEILKRESKDYPFVVFEIGSRDGTDARILKRALPNSDVYAFEANPEEYETFKDENRDIHWTNIAIHNINGKVKFYRKDFYSGIHSIRDRGDIGDRQDVIEIDCIRVDQYCEMINRKVDIAKIDVEGCTYEVLESFGEVINTTRFLHIETERVEYFTGQKLEGEVFDFLRSKGFEMVMNNRIMGLEQSDSIWVRI